MQFHDHPLTHREIIKLLNLKSRPGLSVRDQIAALIAGISDRSTTMNTLAMIDAEFDWIEQRSPYYSVWPAVIEALTTVDLAGVKCESIKLPVNPLMIRLPIGHDLNRAQSIIAAIQQHPAGQILSLAINDATFDIKGVHAHTIVNLELSLDSVSDAFEKSTSRMFSGCLTAADCDTARLALRLVISLCLLANNPDLIDPEPLAADQAKFDSADEELRARLLDKAARRGKIAWSVGRHIEIAPGFRRPHFAIRWCGPGGAEPRLRPIKGCIVKRRLITEVPTGYLVAKEASQSPAEHTNGGLSDSGR